MGWRRSLAVVVMLAACRAVPETPPDPIAVAPIDFGVDFAVRADAPGAADAPVERRPGRFVLFPDGSLHYGVPPGPGGDWRPGLSRRLTREQVAEVWSAARRAGLMDADAAEPPMNFRLVAPGPGETMYLVVFTGDERRWAFARTAGPEEAVDPALAGLVRTLARLAWVSEEVPPPTIVAPIRYDFGPDPYARFRWP